MPSPPDSQITATYLDLLTLAAGELNLVALGDDLSANPALAQRLLNRLVWMVDSWNLKPTVVPWYRRETFPLVAGQQSYLIGQNAPDWNAPRPVRLDPEATNLLLSSTLTGYPPAFLGWYPEEIRVNGILQGQPPYTVNVNSILAGSYPAMFFVNSGGGLPVAAGPTPIRQHLPVLNVHQWANISLPHLAIPFPQGCYLDRSVVTGTNAITGLPYYATRFNVWGVPSTVNSVELFYWYALTVGNLNDPVNASPGYFRAMFLNLSIEIAAGFGMTPSPLTMRNAADALGDLRELNAPDMAMHADPGMPGSRGAGYITKAQFLSGVF